MDNSVTLFDQIGNRKSLRLEADATGIISDRKYNLVMCSVLAWGFLANALMVTYLAGPIQSMVLGIRPLALIIGYFVLAFGGIMLSVKSDNPMVSFIGFNMLVLPMGVMLCIIVPTVPIDILNKALILTGIVTSTMIVLGVTFPTFFLGLGRTLFIALIVGILGEIVASFLLGYRGSAFDWLFVMVFSGYIGWDIAKSQQYPKTVDNAVDCALDIYLDIINLFIRILSILSRRN